MTRSNPPAALDAQQRGGFQTPDDAYRFARGEPIGLSPSDPSGRPTRSAQHCQKTSVPRPGDDPEVPWQIQERALTSPI